MLISPFSFRRRTSAKTLQNSYPMLWIFICRWLSFSESEILSIGFSLAVFQKLIQRMISTRGILRSVSRQFYILTSSSSFRERKSSIVNADLGFERERIPHLTAFASKCVFCICGGPHLLLSGTHARSLARFKLSAAAHDARNSVHQESSELCAAAVGDVECRYTLRSLHYSPEAASQFSFFLLLASKVRQS